MAGLLRGPTQKLLRGPGGALTRDTDCCCDDPEACCNAVLALLAGATASVTFPGSAPPDDTGITQVTPTPPHDLEWGEESQAIPFGDDEVYYVINLSCPGANPGMVDIQVDAFTDRDHSEGDFQLEGEWHTTTELEIPCDEFALDEEYLLELEDAGDFDDATITVSFQAP